MKIQILNTEGKKTKEITTKLFEEPIREDIICKVAESEKMWQAHSNTHRAGMDRSASGNTSKRRHVWKSDRGKGLARLPRKIFWRRGTQFNWEAAIVPGTRGGRRAHPPKSSLNDKKINKKELKKALLSSLSYVSSVEAVSKKYSSLKDKKVEQNLPLVVESKIIQLKTKDFLSSLKKILGNLHDVAIQEKAIRPGIGKLRGRKYKKNAGLLFVVGNKEEKKIKGIEIIQVKDLIVSDLASNGARLTLFSEQGLSDLEKVKEGKTEEDKASSDKSKGNKSAEQSSVKEKRK